jgi:lysophospholipase L1-like esterase
MKTILCYGDSNTWGCPPIESFDEIQRLDEHTRWPCVLRTALGADYRVIEEGLGARTTVWDDPFEGAHKNGRTYLLPCLESHEPLDLVILLLGTNDLKSRFNLSASDIAYAVGTLIDIIQRSECGPGGNAPQVLVVCPPPIAKLTLFAQMFAGAAPKSRLMADFYRQVAETYGCAFLNAGKLIKSSDRDGIHWEAEEHVRMGQAVAARVRDLFTASD